MPKRTKQLAHLAHSKAQGRKDGRRLNPPPEATNNPDEQHRIANRGNQRVREVDAGAQAVDERLQGRWAKRRRRADARAEAAEVALRHANNAQGRLDEALAADPVVSERGQLGVLAYAAGMALLFGLDLPLASAAFAVLGASQLSTFVVAGGAAGMFAVVAHLLGHAFVRAGDPSDERVARSALTERNVLVVFSAAGAVAVGAMRGGYLLSEDASAGRAFAIGAAFVVLHAMVMAAAVFLSAKAYHPAAARVRRERRFARRRRWGWRLRAWLENRAVRGAERAAVRRQRTRDRFVSYGQQDEEFAYARQRAYAASNVRAGARRRAKAGQPIRPAVLEDVVAVDWPPTLTAELNWDYLSSTTILGARSLPAPHVGPPGTITHLPAHPNSKARTPADPPQGRP